VSAPYSVADALAWTGGALVQGEAARVLRGVSIDTRTVGPGELFVAIRGPNHDAHGFVSDAASKGAAALLVEAGRLEAVRAARLPGDLPVIAVDDSARGLTELARGHRAGFTGPVVALTGSNGKTTTKEMCAAILSVAGPCGRTQGNLNNQFGVPLTLLRRRPEDRALVVEIGMNHRGEIAPLAALARPTVGLVTNVGTAHIENLGSADEIALEKGDLVAALDASARAVLNADDPRVLAQRARTRARVVTFGRGAGADVRAEDERALGAQGFAFTLVAAGARTPVEVRGLGETTVINALAAAAAALAAGAPPADVREGLGRYRPPSGRMERIDLGRGIVVIDDTYNANPQSMEAALRSLARLKGAYRGFAVIGDMGELGDTTDAAHRAAGRLVAELGLDALFAVGARAEETARGARDGGLADARIHRCADTAEASAQVRALLRPNDWVLVKGSRSARMERVVEALAAEAKAE
jgi:UDP-N-acetylmuramoyl-tripeptide--D-alanyl-D-alanine ligase